MACSIARPGLQEQELGCARNSCHRQVCQNTDGAGTPFECGYGMELTPGKELSTDVTLAGCCRCRSGAGRADPKALRRTDQK